MFAHPRARKHAFGAVWTIALLPQRWKWRMRMQGSLDRSHRRSLIFLRRTNLRLNLASKFERRPDIPERLLRSAGSGDDDRAIPEQPADNTLLDVDSFDLAEHRLHRAPAEPPHLDDDSLV